MRWIGVLLVFAACGFSSGRAPIDAGVDVAIPPDAFACVHVHLDAGDWGAACSADQTALCHGDLGWCVDGSCRPMCVQPLACLACEGSAEHFTDAGQCYCAP